VVGWQVMALKSAQMAGLDVPERALKQAQRYLDFACDERTEGYGYVGKGSTPTMTAVGLLCRQYLQSWGPQNDRLTKGVDILQRLPPGSINNMYYYYYATQVLHHFGGDSWKKWNAAMRDKLVSTQDKGDKPGLKHQEGSWSPAGDAHGAVGGR